MIDCRVRVSRLVAPGLQRGAAKWHVLQSRSAELLNTLSYFARLERLLICGLKVRFLHGSTPLTPARAVDASGRQALRLRPAASPFGHDSHPAQQLRRIDFSKETSIAIHIRATNLSGDGVRHAPALTIGHHTIGTSHHRHLTPSHITPSAHHRRLTASVFECTLRTRSRAAGELGLVVR